MEKALGLLLVAGYDAYIECEHLYYRTPEGGVVEVCSEAHLESLLRQAEEES